MYEDGWGRMKDHPDWMSLIDDNFSITQLTIPGTHDSHATRSHIDYDRARKKYTGPVLKHLLDRWAQFSDLGMGVSSLTNDIINTLTVAQHWDITSQLYIGVRYLDLRVGEDGNYTMCHGPIPLIGNLFGVLDDIKTFLTSHNKEVVLVSIRWDQDDQPSDMANIIERVWKEKSWYKGSTWPTLGAVRGQAVLLNRFGGSLGIDMDGWWGRKYHSGAAQWSQQDNGKGSEEDIEQDEVWRRGHDHLWDTLTAGFQDGIMYFTGLARWQGKGPLRNAEDMNARLRRHLTEDYMAIDPSKQRLGVIIMDGITTPDATKIIARNWQWSRFSPNTLNRDNAAGNDDRVAWFNNGVRVNFQKDGNLVVYDRDGNDLWASKTTRLWIKYLRFTAKDNLHMDNGESKVMWQGGSKQEENSRLIFMDRPPYIMIETKGGAGEILWTIDA